MFSLRVNLAFGFLLTAWSQLAGAATFHCIGAGDVAGLSAALVHAKSASDTTVIELQQGTYALSGSVATQLDFENPYNAVKLLGGYTPGDSSCSSRTLDAQNTVFDGGGNSQIYLWMGGSLTVEGIRFQNFIVKNGDPGVVFNDFSINGVTMIASHNIFMGVGLEATDYCGDHDQVFITNNLVAGSNQSTGIYAESACIYTTASYAHATDLNYIQLANNTVTGSSASSSVIDARTAGDGIAVFSAGTTDLYNNIAWGNSGADIWLGTGSAGSPAAATANLYNNLYGVLFGSESSASSGTLNVDPQFVDSANGNYRLQTVALGFAADSPAINSGDSATPGLPNEDLDGDDRVGGPARVIGSAPDIGAYESAVDDTIGQTLTVTNANDSGSGSLRQAIIDANNNGGSNHYIEFAINAACPQVIGLASPLPHIGAGSGHMISINGFTQSGSKRNTYPDGDIAKRCIVLDGSGMGSTPEGGITFTGPASSFLWIQGIAFEGFPAAALNLSGGQQNLVWGNQFGGSLFYGAGSLSLKPNAVDVWLCGGNTTSQIGGTDPGSRNIIAGAAGAPPGTDAPYGGRGIALAAYCGSGGNTVTNNLIGFDGFENAHGNGVGIQIETANNTINGNVIGNNANGIQLLGAGANNNTIINNRIGLTEPPLCVIGSCPDSYPAPNQAGIYFWQSAHDNNVYVNTIANNSIFGVEMIDSGTLHNRLGGNSIYANAKEIDLNGYVYGYNNPASTAPNRGLNYPQISAAYGGNANGVILAGMDSSVDTYSIEAFASNQCDASGYGPGEQFVGETSMTISSAPSGQNGGTPLLPVQLHAPSWYSLAGKYIALTATDSKGNTSQFSVCTRYNCDVIFRHGFDTAAGEKCP